MYKIDIEELEDLSKSLNEDYERNFSHFASFNQAIDYFKSEKNLSGEGWDSARAYIEEYRVVADAITSAMFKISHEGLSKYISDFHDEVGSVNHRLDLADLHNLEERKKQLEKEKQSFFGKIHEAIAAAGSWIPGVGPWLDDGTLHETKNKIDILQKYKAFEDSHKNTFHEISGIISSIASGLDYLGDQKNFKSDASGYKALNTEKLPWHKKIEKFISKDKIEIKEDIIQTGNSQMIVYRIYRNGVYDEEASRRFNAEVSKEILNKMNQAPKDATGMTTIEWAILLVGLYGDAAFLASLKIGQKVSVVVNGTLKEITVTESLIEAIKSIITKKEGVRSAEGVPSVPKSGGKDKKASGGKPKSVDGMLKDKNLTNKTGKVENFESPVKGYDEALKDFKKLNPKDIKEYPNGTKVGKLEDGRTVNVRPSSSGGYPTIEIYDPVGMSTLF